MTQLLDAPAPPTTRDELERLLADRPDAYDVFPLSFAQERLWFLARLDPESIAYHVPAGVRLTGRLEGESVERALRRVVERHEVLRTTFVEIEGTPLQLVHHRATARLRVVDVSDAADPEAAARDALDDEVARPFDLARGPLLRSTLVRLSAEEQMLVLVFHHIVADGWSAGLVIGELETLLRRQLTGETAALPELDIQYADYAAWQREHLEGERLDALLEFWRRQLAAVEPLDLGLGGERGRSDGAAHRARVHLEPATASALRSLAAREGATVYAVLLALFQTLLARLSGQDDFAVGTPVAGRSRPEIEPLAGCFVNTLALRADVGEATSFRHLVGRVGERVVDVLAHQELPFERLVATLEPERNLETSPVFQALLVWQNLPGARLALPGLEIETLDLAPPTTKFPLSAHLSDGDDGGIDGRLAASGAGWSADTVAAAARAFETLARSAVAQPDRPLGELRLVDGRVDGTDAPAGEGTPTLELPAIHRQVARRAVEEPSAVALISRGEERTYGELAREAAAIARQVLAAAPAGRPVALLAERSVEAVTALLGILWAGVPYLPLDPAAPGARLRASVDDAGARHLIALGVEPPPELTDLLDSGALELLEPTVQETGGELPEPSDVAPEQPAYVLFTSGSTGRPKGVVVSHGALSAYVGALLGRLRPALGPDGPWLHGERWASVSTLAADLGNTSVFGALASGATLLLASADEVMDGVALGELFGRARPDVLKIVPSHLAALLDAGDPELLLPAKDLVLGGEATPWELVDRVVEAAGRRGAGDGATMALWNHYGPTEATVGVVAGRLDGAADRDGATRAARPPLGHPLGEMAIRLLDRHLQPVPAGLPGEIHIAGPSLAAGYAGRPAATAAAFVPDPFPRHPGARLYATGDRGRRLPDGRLSFLGRLDDQVKIGGHRIEAGEVAAVLRRHPAVGQAAVVPHGDPGALRLAAYVVTCHPDGAGPTAEDLRRWCGEHLAQIAVPASVSFLPSLPLTPNGKLDRRRLPAPAAERPVVASGPMTATEEVMARLWAQVLELDAVGPDDDFFRLGGHSLLAMRLVARVRTDLGLEMPVRWLFEAPTVRRLAARLGSARGRVVAPLERLSAAERAAPLPLAPSQERIWFLQQMAPDSPAYNLPYFVRLEGRLDLPALAGSLAAVLERHEVLRTAFPERDGRPVQEIHHGIALPLAVVDLRGLGAVPACAAARRLADDEAARPFDLARAPQVRATLVRLDATETWLLASLHHIVSDAWSRALLQREIAGLYDSAVAGTAAELPALPVQYADFAVAQRRWLSDGGLDRQLEVWRARLDGLEPLELPTDHPRPSSSVHRGASERFRFDGDVTGALRRLAHAAHGSLFMVLLAAYQAWLGRWSGQDDLAVGTAVAGRDRPELEALLGVFINTLVLRADLAGDPTFEELLAQARERSLEAFAHQDVPFELLVETLVTARDLERSPLFQALFLFQNAPEAGSRLGDLTLSQIEAASGRAKFDLSLALEEVDGGLAGTLEYSADLFDRATARRMVASFQELVRSVAEQPDRRLSELCVLPPGERRRLLEEWNPSVPEPASPVAVLRPVDQIVHRSGLDPDAVAVAGETGEALTWGELDRRSRRLAGHLRRLGVGPESRVGVCLGRTVDLVVALLGVLRSGGAYVPLDPGYPADRLAWMIDDSGLDLVVGDDPLPGAGRDLTVVDPAAAADDSGGDLDDDLAPVPGGLAYVIYTSGSTGRPKGVAVTSDNLGAFFHAMDRHLGVDPESTASPGVWWAVTSYSFDISVLELLWTLARGFVVRLAGESPLAAAGLLGGPVPDGAVDRDLPLGLFYFSSDAGNGGNGGNGGNAGNAGGAGGDAYRLLLEGARLGDRQGFTAVWTPERHFHAFGGLFPNPSVLAAALAMVTERISLRAGSVVLPLQNPVRVAEEWAVVDRLSGGRVGVSFASGWHADDFVLAPDAYGDRKERMFEGIETVRGLWRGESRTLPNGAGEATEIRIHPRPVQAELPFWVTAGGSPETFERAGTVGGALLTHLTGQTPAELEAKIRRYRAAWRQAGHPGDGHVTLMLHTYLGDSLDAARETVRRPLSEYLRSSLGLWRGLARSFGHDPDDDSALSPAEEEAILAHGFERYFENGGLLGTAETVGAQMERFRALGVDEAACLIDFGVPFEESMASLERLARLRRQLAGEGAASTRGATAAPDAPRDVPPAPTHLQCTPSMARLLLADPQSQRLLAGLDHLLLGGEAVPASLVAELEGVTGARIHDMYGPTETTIWSTAEALERGAGRVTIGRPIAGERAHVVDRFLTLEPVGVPGELLVGGAGVVRGYLDRPAATAERFVPDPFAGTPGARLYRTGDRVRRLADGRLDYLERLDQQVKVRGHRIEPEEIEAVLEEQPGVARAVVVARTESDGEVVLAAYVVPERSGPALEVAVPPERAAELFEGRRRYVLPNGMAVAVLSEFQASLAYQEIFARRNYLRYGIRLEPGATVFDVGANVGFFTLFAGLHAPGARIHSFEPIPPTFDTLRTNVELYGLDATVHPMGLGRREEEVEFTFYPNMSGLSGRYSEPERDRRATRAIWAEGMARVDDDDRGRELRDLGEDELEAMLDEQFRSETHRCRVSTLSRAIAEAGVETIDLLKIDVERAELDVLEGLADEDWPKVRQLVLEVDTRENLERIEALLRARGYGVAVEDLYDLDSPEVGQGSSEDDVYVGFLFASREPGAVEDGHHPPPSLEAPSERAEPAGPPVTAERLRTAVARRLPPFMVPATFTLLDRLPLTPAGKVDRRALPAPTGTAEPRAEMSPPRSELERTVVAVWRDVLHRQALGVEDNFFEVGGTSLRLVTLRTRLGERLGVELSLVDLFGAPTVAQQARLIEGRQSGSARADDGGDDPGERLGEVRTRARKRRGAVVRRRSDPDRT